MLEGDAQVDIGLDDFGLDRNGVLKVDSGGIGPARNEIQVAQIVGGFGHQGIEPKGAGKGLLCLIQPT